MPKYNNTKVVKLYSGVTGKAIGAAAGLELQARSHSCRTRYTRSYSKIVTGNQFSVTPTSILLVICRS